MEPGVREFFQRIGYSIGVGFLWLAITAIAAIKNDNAFIEGGIRIANALFYVWFIISVFLLIKILKKIWNRKYKVEEMED